MAFLIQILPCPLIIIGSAGEILHRAEIVAERIAECLPFLIKRNVQTAGRRGPAHLIQEEVDMCALDVGDVEQHRAGVPVGVDDGKTAFQNIVIDLLEREQILSHLIDQFGAFFCGQESDIDGVAAEYIDRIGTLRYQTGIVRQVVGIREYRAVLIAEHVLQNQRGEGAGEGHDDLIGMHMALQKLCIIRMCERRADKADIMCAFHRFRDVRGHLVQLDRSLKFFDITLQSDRLRLEDFLHVVRELRHFIQIDGMSSQGKLRCHRVRSVSSA